MVLIHISLKDFSPDDLALLTQRLTSLIATKQIAGEIQIFESLKVAIVPFEQGHQVPLIIKLNKTSTLACLRQEVQRCGLTTHFVNRYIFDPDLKLRLLHTLAIEILFLSQIIAKVSSSNFSVQSYEQAFRVKKTQNPIKEYVQ